MQQSRSRGKQRNRGVPTPPDTTVPELDGLYDFGVSFKDTSGTWYRADEIKNLIFEDWEVYTWDLSEDQVWDTKIIEELKLEPMMPVDTLGAGDPDIIVDLSWVKLKHD